MFVFQKCYKQYLMPDVGFLRNDKLPIFQWPLQTSGEARAKQYLHKKEDVVAQAWLESWLSTPEWVCLKKNRFCRRVNCYLCKGTLLLSERIAQLGLKELCTLPSL